MTRYSADAVLSGLKGFQRDSVAHVVKRFYSDGASRFLIADETGLGKSIVAKGVVAECYERLQDDPTVERVDIVYVCSNSDIARQNVAHLKVAGSEHLAIASRLTMLAKHSSKLRVASASKKGAGTSRKAINVFAFTPGTSFDKGWRTGKAEERALLFLILEERLSLTGWDRFAARRVLQATTRSAKAFDREIERLRDDLGNRIDKSIASRFMKDARQRGYIGQFRKLISDAGHKRTLPKDMKDRARELIGAMRGSLARASIDLLEPDLIILDEFQRFRDLLSVDAKSESSELAQQLFEYRDAKVLLLSATPYKPYTLAEEATGGDDHYRDFIDLLKFLRKDRAWLLEVEELFSDFRSAVIEGRDPSAARAKLEPLLLTVMSRVERPPLAQSRMLSEVQRPADDVSASDLRGFVALRKLADEVKSPGTVEYWKSAPYFVNFLEGYKIGEKLRAALAEPKRAAELQPLIASAQLLSRESIRKYEPIDMGNGRLRALARQTVEDDWWRLLWMPPSMPYYELSEPFASVCESGITKRLVFSSWTATPTAVAGLLSYEADRRMFSGSGLTNTPEDRATAGPRLEYRADDAASGTLSTLALFWPHPGLAKFADSLAFARTEPNEVSKRSAFESMIDSRLRNEFGRVDRGRKADSAAAWDLFMAWPESVPIGSDEDTADVRASIVAALAGTLGLAKGQKDTEEDGASLGKGLSSVVDAAFEVVWRSRRHGAVNSDAVTDLVKLAAYSPGNSAWRALGRVIVSSDSVTPAGHWLAAAVVAAGVRTLFNRPETIRLMDQQNPGGVYWRSVLEYCASGCLQAVLDEYVHHLRSAAASTALTDESLMEMAQRIRGSLALRPARYRAFDPHHPNDPIPLISRFALRYGGGRDDEDKGRLPEIREAFNSPFWPFVLATTSAGQEGIDFHWWCSAIVHWNLPANPVDFEQREGRVHRFGGHAIRRNVAGKHRTQAMAAETNDVWAAAYEAASANPEDLGEFAPYWVYPGEAHIERYLLPYPLSRDLPRAEQLKKGLALYRLALGQPRQEDMLQFVMRGANAEGVAESQALNLRPPKA